MAEQPSPLAASTQSANGGSAQQMSRETGATPAAGSHHGPAATSASIRYFAAARAAAGTAQESITIHGGCTVGQLLAAAVAGHGPELAKVLQRCSYLLDGVAVHSTDAVISTGQTLDVLPPFAGG